MHLIIGFCRPFFIFTDYQLLKMTKFLLFFTILIIQFGLYSQTPTANFTGTPLNVCTGNVVTFTSTSNPNGASQIVSYVWDYGDGGPFGSGQTSTHIYSTPGLKTVTLTVANSNGTADAEVKMNYINVLPSPTAEFSISGIGCTVPLTLTYNNLSTAGASYNWVFGNGQISNAQNPPSQTYNTAGNYDAILTVTASNGCIAKDTEAVVVSNYQADIIVPSIGCIGQPVSFQDNSTAGANSWNWNFGGQGTSTNQNPTFTFSSAGTYTIQLSSQNTNSGCSASTSQQITIQPTPSPTFTASPTSNCAPAIINFTNTSQGGTNYVWDFGDGQQFTGANPGSHTYFVNGTYDVTLTMTTANGCSGNLVLSDYINITDVEAHFNANVTGGCNPLTVQFTDSSITPSSSNPIVSWNWTFGNGQSFNGQNPPAQTYTNGIYDVSLTVTTQSGCTGTITMNDYITVGQLNSINFSVDTLVNCIKTDFHFNSSISTTPSFPDSSEIHYYWDFTDGTSTQTNPTYQFTSDTGYFDVQLVVDYRGCKDTLKIDSLIYINAPIAKFTPDNTLFCNPSGIPVSAHMTDIAIHGDTSDDVLMTWKWGDGTPNTILDDPQLDDGDLGSISHSYNNYGSYTIEQVIYNYTTGCKDSTTRTVDISQLTPLFSFSNDSICQGDSLVMFDHSTTWSNPPTPHPLESWEFDMGNGSVVTGDTAYYVYQNSGVFTVTLTATNSVGCSADTSFQVTVLAPPFAVLGADGDTICSYQTVNFTNGSISFDPNIPLSSFEYQFSDDSSTVITNSIATPVSHVFIGEGIYYTTMIAINQFGCQSSPATIPIVISRPNAFFSVNNIICNNDSINTVNSSTGLAPLLYEWLIDGNSFSTNENAGTIFTETNIPIGQTSSVHDLSLAVTDSRGCTDTITNLVTVSIPWAFPTFTFTGAGINSEGEFICPPIFGSYIDSSISYGAINEWNWDFGNTNTSTLETPNNTYALPGVYSLTLSVVDEYGCTADTTLIDYVAIGGPSGEPAWVQIIGQCAQGANFTVVNAVNVDSTVWDMGDNNIIYDSVNFHYNYDEAGTYTPGVTLIDTGGCEVFYPLDPVTVIDDGLTAFYTATPNPAGQNEIITFTDGSVSVASTVVGWLWDFNNDSIFSLNSNNQFNSFPIAGDYSVSLTVTDALGCQDTYIGSIHIKDPEIWLPNVITTNNDGINELFILPFDAFKDFTVIILNRWGNVMRIGQRDPANPVFLWDGTDQDGTICTDGVYFYHITGEMLGGTMVDKEGFVTVIESK